MSVGAGPFKKILAREGLSFANLRGMGSEGDDSADEPADEPAEGAADPRPEDVPEDEPARAGLPG